MTKLENYLEFDENYDIVHSFFSQPKDFSIDFEIPEDLLKYYYSSSIDGLIPKKNVNYSYSLIKKRK